jgi:hypothetical protein
MSSPWDEFRDAVRDRAGHRCEYCHLPEAFSEQVFEVDHIIARKHRGKSTLGNLSWTCFACNNHKAANIAGICPVTGRLVGLFHPRRHKWSRHFRWNGSVLVGKTPIGRATVDVLEINLTYRVALRSSLLEESVAFD